MTLGSYLPPALECLQPSDGYNGATFSTVLFAGAEVVVFEKVPPPQSKGPHARSVQEGTRRDGLGVNIVVKVVNTSTGSFQSQELGWRWDINMSKRLP